MCRLERSCELRCRLWGLGWKSTLEVAVRWSSSPTPPPPSSPSPSSSPPINHQRQGNVKKQAISVMLAWHWILSFPSNLHHLLLLCRLTAALWARATKPVPTRHASKKQERGNADLGRDSKVKGQGNKRTKWRRRGDNLCIISEVLVHDELCIIYSGKCQEKPNIELHGIIYASNIVLSLE